MEKLLNYLIDWARKACIDTSEIDSKNNINLDEKKLLIKAIASKEFIQMLKESLISMAFTDIKKAYSGGSKMGTFILCVCFIDYFSTYYSGEEADSLIFAKFLEKYLPKYNKPKIYEFLRTQLVHYYSERGYLFIDNYPEIHLFEYKNKIFINLKIFIDDIENATIEYFTDITQSDELFWNAVKMFKSHPLNKEQELIYKSMGNNMSTYSIIATGSTSYDGVVGKDGIINPFNTILKK